MKGIYISLITFIFSFLVTVLFMPYWIRKAKQIGLIWKDMNKYKKIKVAGSGGIVSCFAFFISVLLFIAFRTFYLNESSFLLELIVILLVTSFLAGIGLIDDLFGWQQGGLSRRSRMILVAISAIPLMAINAGRSVVAFPFIGVVDLGFIYPLFLIPLGIVGATTIFNFLAGFNGLEAGQGIILLTAAAIVSYFTGNSWLSIVSLCAVAALLGLLIFNKYPAQVFPGNSITYVIGGLFATISILGNFERIAVFFFIPYFIEMILKIRGKLVKQSFGLPKKDESLELRYDKIYGLTHMAILILKKLSIKPTERKVVVLIWIIQTLVIVTGFILFRNGVFL